MWESVWILIDSGNVTNTYHPVRYGLASNKKKYRYFIFSGISSTSWNDWGNVIITIPRIGEADGLDDMIIYSKYSCSSGFDAWNADPFLVVLS